MEGSAGTKRSDLLLLTSEIELILGAPASNRSIVLGVFDVTSITEGFLSLVFELDVDGTLQSESFSDPG